jgi:hypothetical protein
MSAGDGLVLAALAAVGWMAAGAWERVADRISCDGGGRTAPTRRQGAVPWVGSLVPVAAWTVIPGAAATAFATAAGLLLLGIVICDERTLRIPHVLTIAGLALGLVAAAAGCGWQGFVQRAAAVALVCVVFASGAELVSRILGQRAVGSADAGVIAFLASLGGVGAIPDLLLLGGLLALSWTVVETAPPRLQLPYAVLGLLAAVVSGLAGTAGAAVGALVLALILRPQVTAGTVPPAPLGACLSAGAFMLLLPLPEFASAAASVLQTHGCR